MSDLTDEQYQEILDVTGNILQFGGPDDLTFDKKPKVFVLEKALGFDIDADDRDRAYAEATEHVEGVSSAGEEEVYRPVNVEEGYGKDPFEKFCRVQKAEAGAQGMSEAHHPDVHYLGADANSCVNCDASMPSLKEQFDAA